MGLGVKAAALIAISLFVVAIVMPVALLAIADANTTGWNASVITVFQVLLPILAVVGLAIKFIPRT